MRLFHVPRGAVIEHQGQYRRLETSWHSLTIRDDLLSHLEREFANGASVSLPDRVLSPIAAQEVWAAGVTYYRSRTARMEESQTAGGGSFYDRVYNAERPELFFKSTPHRIAAPGSPVHIRKDAKWNVPEPELALLVTPSGKLTGYSVGNDMSSRDIEGENPLYLPQAKVYDRSCALGPGILVFDAALCSETRIRMEILRNGRVCFSGETSLAQMKRSPETLIEYLFRENSFPNGCFLLTGTGIVPPDSFTLSPGDLIRITIDEIGTLENPVD